MAGSNYRGNLKSSLRVFLQSIGVLLISESTLKHAGQTIYTFAAKMDPEKHFRIVAYDESWSITALEALAQLFEASPTE